MDFGHIKEHTDSAEAIMNIKIETMLTIFAITANKATNKFSGIQKSNEKQGWSAYTQKIFQSTNHLIFIKSLYFWIQILGGLRFCFIYAHEAP